MDLQLSGKRAVVSGASAGIGRETVKILAEEGVKTVVIGRNEAALQALAKEIAEKNAPIPVVVVDDLNKRDAIARVRDKVLSAVGGVEFLINNLGQSRGFGLDTPDEDWDEAFELNFTSPRKLAQAFLPGMIERKFGRIICLTATTEPGNVSGSMTSKAALVIWAKGLSRVVGKDGITVNCVTPGITLTPQILNNFFPKTMPTKETQQAFLDREIPLGRFGEPADCANLIAFLCSDKASYITGQRIYVDGGWKRSI